MSDLVTRALQRKTTMFSPRLLLEAGASAQLNGGSPARTAAASVSSAPARPLLGPAARSCSRPALLDPAARSRCRPALASYSPFQVCPCSASRSGPAPLW